MNSYIENVNCLFISQWFAISSTTDSHVSINKDDISHISSYIFSFNSFFSIHSYNTNLSNLGNIEITDLTNPHHIYNQVNKIIKYYSNIHDIT